MNRNYILKYGNDNITFSSPLMILEFIFEECDVIYTFGNEMRLIININDKYYKVFITSRHIDITQKGSPNIHLFGLPVTYFNSQLKELENDPQIIMQNVFVQMKNLVGRILLNNCEYDDSMIESISKIPKNPYK